MAALAAAFEGHERIEGILTNFHQHPEDASGCIEVIGRFRRFDQTNLGVRSSLNVVADIDCAISTGVSISIYADFFCRHSFSLRP